MIGLAAMRRCQYRSRLDRTRTGHWISSVTSAPTINAFLRMLQRGRNVWRPSPGHVALGAPGSEGTPATRPWITRPKPHSRDNLTIAMACPAVRMKSSTHRALTQPAPPQRSSGHGWMKSQWPVKAYDLSIKRHPLTFILHCKEIWNHNPSLATSHLCTKNKATFSS